MNGTIELQVDGRGLDVTYREDMAGLELVDACDLETGTPVPLTPHLRSLVEDQLMMTAMEYCDNYLRGALGRC